MEETVKERIISFLNLKNISQNKFETNCDLPRSYIANMGKSPGTDILKKIKTAYPEISLDYLVLGKGDILVDEKSHQNNSNIIASQEISKKDEEISFLRSIISKLTAQPEVPHVSNPSTDIGIKYYEEMMRELKEVKEEIKKTM